MESRERILNEIRKLAEESGGRSPGRQVFERRTGIKQSAWLGVYWARWNDAISDAGLQTNSKQGKLGEQFVFEKLAAAFRHFGCIPTSAEMRLYGNIDRDFPSHSTINNHFRTKAEMLDRFASWIARNGGYSDVATMLGDRSASTQAESKSGSLVEGLVYLIRSGSHYKIGRSEELERRVKEIRIALPEAAILVHAIRTDDPPGIEAYWHKRFADRRANGEWFRLTATDVASFRRRKYQ